MPVSALRAMSLLNTVVTHLEPNAQVLYWLYEACFSMYRELLRESERAKYETERSTNIVAITAHQCPWSRGGGETFNQQYIYACNLAAQVKLKRAEKVLKGATQAATFLHEGTHEETEIIKVIMHFILTYQLLLMIGIQVQLLLGYMLQKQGRFNEAQTIYNQVRTLREA